MKVINKVFQKHRRIKIVLSVLFAIVMISIIVVNVTPTPSVLFVRKLFENSGNTAPIDYKEVKSEVDLKKNLEYESKNNMNKFDLYTPKESNKKSDNPTILWVHGGAFVGGDKRDIEFFATKLASDGYTVISMNYELAPEKKYPTPVLQVADIIEYLKKDTSKFENVNLDNIFFAGDSAGAQIVTQYVITQTNESYRKKMGFERQFKKNSINGTLLYCGPYDVEQLTNLSSSTIVKFVLNQVGWSYLGEKDWKTSNSIKEASVVTHINKDFPASYITDGNKNSFEQQGKHLGKKLRGLNVKVKERYFNMKEYETGHEYQFKMKTKPATISYDDTIEFLKVHQRQ